MATELKRTYRELPPSTFSGEALPPTIRAILTELESGSFYRAALLAERMDRDDRISGVLGTRVNALFGLERRFEPRGDGRRSSAVAVDAERLWPEMLPEDEFKQLIRWGLLLGIGIGENLWDTSRLLWKPRLKVWHPQHLAWRWDTESYWLTTRDGGQVEVKPGDPKWVIFAPYGYRRGWMQALIRPLALPWLNRNLALRDWARYSEAHGLPTRVGTIPAGSDTTGDSERFLEQLYNLGSEAVILLSKEADGKGYDFDLVEANGGSPDTFRQLVEKADESIAVAVLGQNLTTTMKTGGSYAAANVHDRVRAEFVKADARSASSMAREYILKPWARFNFGDEELAPLPKFLTDALEDGASTAGTMKALGEAIAALDAAGIEADVDELARRTNLPIKRVAKSAPAPQSADEEDEEQSE